MIFRIYHETQGNHVHMRVFSGIREGALGKCGDLCMRVEEFAVFKDAANFIQFREGQSPKRRHFVRFTQVRFQGRYFYGEVLAKVAWDDQHDDRFLVRDWYHPDLSNPPKPPFSQLAEAYEIEDCEMPEGYVPAGVIAP